jgi:hypothetical protein
LARQNRKKEPSGGLGQVDKAREERYARRLAVKIGSQGKLVRTAKRVKNSPLGKKNRR